jgi:hypothetical protein
LSGTNIRVPIRQELKDINLSPSETIMSIVVALFGPTESVSGSSNPLDKGFASPDPSDVGPALPDLLGKGFALLNPWGSDSLLDRSKGPERGLHRLNHYGHAPSDMKRGAGMPRRDLPL